MQFNKKFSDKFLTANNLSQSYASSSSSSSSVFFTPENSSFTANSDTHSSIVFTDTQHSVLKKVSQRNLPLSYSKTSFCNSSEETSSKFISGFPKGNVRQVNNKDEDQEEEEEESSQDETSDDSSEDEQEKKKSKKEKERQVQVGAHHLSGENLQVFTEESAKISSISDHAQQKIKSLETSPAFIHNVQETSLTKSIEDERRKIEKTKKKEKKNKKTERLYISLTGRLSKIANLLEKDFDKKLDSKITKELAKNISKYERDLQKLSRHLKDPKIKNFSQSTIPFGLLRALDNYDEPMFWIKKKLLDEQKTANDKLRGALFSLGSLRSSLEYRLCNNNIENVVSPTFAACAALGSDLRIPVELQSRYANINIEKEGEKDKLIET